MKRFPLIFLLCIFVASCHQEAIDESFLLDDSVRMIYEGREVFRYEALNCQLSFNKENREFCSGTDTMSDYFAVRLNDIPFQTGQTVSGWLEWTTTTSIRTKDNVALEVVRLEGDIVWLWNSSGRTGLVIRVLD